MPVLRHAPPIVLVSLLAASASPAAMAQVNPLTELRAGIDQTYVPDGRPLDPIELLLKRGTTRKLKEGEIVLDPVTGEPIVEMLDDLAAAETADDPIVGSEQAQSLDGPALLGPPPPEDLEETEQDLFDPPPPGLDGVTTRQRQELEPLGLRLGAFTVSSDIEAVVETTDNVLAAGRQRRPDILYVLRPRLSVRSNWARHAFGAEYAGKYGAHADTSSQDPRSTRLAADGRLDLAHGSAIALRTSYVMDREGAGDVDVGEGAAQIPFRVVEIGGEVSHRVNRLSGALRGAVAVSDYDDSAGAFGAPVNNDDRDRTLTGLGLRLAYELSPATTVFADAYYARDRHRQPIDDLGFARDSRQRTLIAGVVLRPSRLIEVEASAGHVREDFADGRLAAVDEATANARLVWAVTPLTTLNAEFATDVGPTTLAGASASVIRTVRGGVDHELLRNLIVSGTSSFSHAEYRGITLVEETATAGIGAEYWLTRGAAMIARYEHSVEESSQPGTDDVVESRATFGVRLRH